MPESKRRKPKEPAESRRRQATSTKREPSSKWYVVTMAGLMAVGVLLVLVRFVFGLDQLWLLAGLVLIAGGFLMTTNYR